MNLRIAQFYLLVTLSQLVSAAAFASLPSISGRQSLSFLRSSSSEEAQRLKQSASKLREEAEAIRKRLDDSSQKKKSPSTTVTPSTPPVAYTDLKGSSWTLTYRFSNEPTADDDQKDKKEDRPALINYSGKLSVTFRADGYTDLISHEPSGSQTLYIDKVWGWDEETSSDDDETYVLFSVNTKSSSGETERFYWQARIDVNEKNEITLADGTVTMKKDVQPPGGFWGVFNGGGILAQFRYVGNFGGKAVRV